MISAKEARYLTDPKFFNEAMTLIEKGIKGSASCGSRMVVFQSDDIKNYHYICNAIMNELTKNGYGVTCSPHDIRISWQEKDKNND